MSGAPTQTHIQVEAFTVNRVLGEEKGKAASGTDMINYSVENFPKFRTRMKSIRIWKVRPGSLLARRFKAARNVGYKVESIHRDWKRETLSLIPLPCLVMRPCKFRAETNRHITELHPLIHKEL